MWTQPRERERRGEATKGLQEDTRKEKMRENGRYKGLKEVKEKKRKKKEPLASLVACENGRCGSHPSYYNEATSIKSQISHL